MSKTFGAFGYFATRPSTSPRPFLVVGASRHAANDHQLGVEAIRLVLEALIREVNCRLDLATFQVQFGQLELCFDP